MYRASTKLVLLGLLTCVPWTRTVSLEVEPVLPAPQFILGFDLDGIANDGIVDGVPGDTISVRGHVTLDSPAAGVSGWSYGFLASGGDASFDGKVTQGCDRSCLAELLGLETGDVFFHQSEVVGPTGGPTSGVISAVALRPFPSPVAALSAGHSRLLPFELKVRVPEEPPGEVVTLEFRSGLVGSRGAVEIDIRLAREAIDATLRPLRFLVRPTSPFRLGFELNGVENGGAIDGEPGETLSLEGHVTLTSPVDGVSGWTFGFVASGAGAYFVEQSVEACDEGCLSGLLGLGSDDVFFQASQVVDPALHDQGAGVVSAVALRIFPPPAYLTRGMTRLLPFELAVTVPEDPEGEIVELRFRDGLVGSGQPVAVGVNLLSRSVNAVLDTFRFRVHPTRVPHFVRGDCSEDGVVDITDPLCMLRWFFSGTPPRCVSLTDVNGDSAIDLSDPITILLYLFLRGAPPVEPFPACGPAQSTADEALGCGTPPEICR